MLIWQMNESARATGVRKHIRGGAAMKLPIHFAPAAPREQRGWESNFCHTTVAWLPSDLSLISINAAVNTSSQPFELTIPIHIESFDSRLNNSYSSSVFFETEIEISEFQTVRKLKNTVKHFVLFRQLWKLCNCFHLLRNDTKLRERLKNVPERERERERERDNLRQRARHRAVRNLIIRWIIHSCEINRSFVIASSSSPPPNRDWTTFY